jgi:hypothetical protein
MDWVSLIQTLGLPTALLLLILLALGRAGVWAANNLVKPLVDKHIEFLDKAIEANDTIARSQAEITKALMTMNDRLDRLSKEAIAHA